MLALCEQCGHTPAHPVCQDPDDPWFLCPWCQNELYDRLQAAKSGPRYSLDDVLAELAGSA